MILIVFIYGIQGTPNLFLCSYIYVVLLFHCNYGRFDEDNHLPQWPSQYKVNHVGDT